MVEVVDRDPEDVPDEEAVQAIVDRRYASAAVVWTVGAVLVAVASVVRALVGDLIDPLAPGNLILHAATVAGYVAGALTALAAMRLWRYRIRALEDRLDRYRGWRRYRAVRLGLVVLFAFVAGTIFWYIDFPIVALLAVALGFPVLLAIAYERWDRLDERGQELVVLGGGLVGLHPISMIVLGPFGPLATAGGYALVAAGLVRPVLARGQEEEPGDEPGETEPAPAEDHAEPSR